MGSWRGQEGHLKRKKKRAEMEWGELEYMKNSVGTMKVAVEVSKVFGGFEQRNNSWSS